MPATSLRHFRGSGALSTVFAASLLMGTPAPMGEGVALCGICLYNFRETYDESKLIVDRILSTCEKIKALPYEIYNAVRPESLADRAP